MSVDLPAPFSPRRAWTSPARRSKSTPSLATIRPKRFVMPRSSSAASMRVGVLLLLERQADDVLRLALHLRGREVDDRELRLRELLRRSRDGVGHQEAVADDEVVLLLGQRREVRDVVRVLLGHQHAALDPEILDGPLEPLVGQLVERAVVEAADVGDETDLDLLALRGGRCAAGRPAAAALVAA